MTNLFYFSNQVSSERQCRLLRCVLGVVLVVVTAMTAGCASQRERLGSGLKLPANHDSFMKRWYAGFSMGGTQLDPDLSDVGFSLKKGSGTATQMRLGYDLHNLFSVELDTSLLGAAEMEATAEVQDWSAYARLGYSYTPVASNVQVLDGQDVSGAIFGIGVEYGMPNGLGFRMEATRYHEQANYLGLGAIYRFGNKERGRPQLLAKKTTLTNDPYQAGEPSIAGARFSQPAQTESGLPGVLQQGPKPVVESKTTPRVPASQSENYVSKVLVATVKDLDGDGVSNEFDECANTRPGTSVDAEGCGLFDGVIEGVTFNDGDSSLNNTSKRILDRVAVQLIAFPEVRVEVQGHTDDQGPSEINQLVSETRANRVVSNLVNQGVDQEQLSAKGFGEIRPRRLDENEYGRLANRRIELLTLPDLDIVPRHVTLIAPAVTSQPLNSSPGALMTGIATTHATKDSGSGNAKAKESATEDAVATAEPEALENVLENLAKSVSPTASSEPELGAAVAALDEAELLPAPIEIPGESLNGPIAGVGFEGRSENLAADASKPLRKLASKLKRYPTTRVAVMVHTDEVGSSDEDLDLTMNQASTVKAFLEQNGVEGDRIEIEGYGSNLPVVQSVSEEDRLRNRRVELRVLSR